MKREVVNQLQRDVFGKNDESSLGLTELEGDTKDYDELYRTVMHSLSTRSLFGDAPNFVYLQSADEFISAMRPKLEAYSEKPFSNAILLLDVKTWPSNTRLAKKLNEAQGLVVDCSPFKTEYGLKSGDCTLVRKWLIGWAKSQYQVSISEEIVDVMIEIVSLDPGLLNQELAKLVGAAGKSGTITLEMVHSMVGNWRTRTAWDMIDAASEGNAAEAIKQLNRLIAAGEAPQAILPMMASALRKFAAATRLILDSEKERRKMGLQEALKKAGVLPFKVGRAEQQLRQIGRVRAAQLTDWLLHADLEIKGLHSKDDGAHFVIERLIAQLAAAKTAKVGG